MSTIQERAASLRDHCLESSNWPPALLAEVVRDTASAEGSRAFFSIVVESLADLFEPRLCDVYARLFSEVIGQPELAARYKRIREPRVWHGADPKRVFVLSRVTLGADIAVTSVLLDAAKRRFPGAEIVFVGPRKNWELFSGDPRILHRDSPYGRSALLAGRIAAKPEIEEGDSIVLDPDSRLSQLGILPVCHDDSYFFFESRAYGADTTHTLSTLASLWASETFGISGARPFIALPPFAAVQDQYSATVSLGVGENSAKCYDLRFETNLLRMLPAKTCIDTGASEEEALRVRSAARAEQDLFKGSFAAFVAILQKSGLFVGYDSAAGHAAAACGVPMISIFRGAASDRMFERWKPSGPAETTHVIRADGKPEQTLDLVSGALRKLSTSK